MFFFGDYQGTRSHIGGSGQERIPTLAERGGDLSDLLPTQIYDPCTTSGGVFVATCDVDPTLRAPFTGNIIPTTRLSQQALNLLKLIPVGANGTGLNPNFFGSGNNVLDSNGFDGRGDAYVSNKIHVFGRYSFQQFTRSGPGLFGNLAGGKAIPSDPSVGDFAGTSKVRNQSLASGFDYTLNTHWLTDFRFGYFRYRVNVLPGGFGTHPATDAGIPGLNVDNFYTTGMPYFAVRYPGSGINSLFAFGYALGAESEGHCNCPLTEKEHQYQFVNNWTKILGNHQFKFGGDIRYALNLRVPSDRHRTGEISFSRDFTSDPSNKAAPGGSGLATLLLGQATTLSRYVSSSTSAAERQKRWFFYGQDTFRLTPKLTLNYGLRWEIYFPETVNKAGNGALLNLNDGTLHVAGIGGVPMNMGVDNSYKNFAPRLGIAYQVTPKTVVRMGYGRSFDIGVFGSVFGHTVTQNLPVLANQNLNAPSQTTGVFTLTQGPPAPTVTPVPSNGLLPLPIGINGRARPFRMRIPTLDAYNVTVQHQFTNTLSGEVAYVGNKGTHVFAGNNPDINANQPSVVGFKAGVPKDQRRPFFGRFGWTQDITDFANSSGSNYNALQTKIDKRFSHGLQLQAHYTWSRALNYDQDYFAIQPHYGLVDFNRQHVFVANSVYELPFGRGKPYMSNISKVMDYIIGGYQMSGTLTWSSGLPFNVSYGECSADIDSGPCWAAKTGGTSTSLGDLQTPATGSPFRTFFTPVASSTFATSGGNGYRRPAPETFGSRNSLYGPRYANVDFSVAKRFAITERVNTQFRLEVFNLFNHPQLSTPNGCIDCTGDAGQIKSLQSNIGQMRNLQFGLRVDF